MKKILYILLLTIGTINAQFTLIPDGNFESQLISDGHDDIFDGRVLTVNIENVTDLDVSANFITSIVGIQDFTALEFLNASNNSLVSANLTQNTNLIHLNLSHNQIVSLDLTGNPNLEYVSFISQWNGDFFSLINIDVSECYSLVHLNLDGNGILENFNISNSPNLTYLDIGGANVTQLDVSNNSLLEYLYIGSTYVESLDLNNVLNLTFLSIANTNISNIDLTHNINLETLHAQYLDLESLDITNNINLKYLICLQSNLNELDVTNNIHLVSLLCQTNNITSLNLNNCTEIEEVDAGYNNLTNFSIRNGNNEIITWMRVHENNELTCVEVDDAEAATNNTYPYNQANWTKSINAVWSNDCNALAIDDYALEDQIIIYPNPIKKTFNIINNNIKITAIEIYNQLGKRLKITNKINHIDISNFNTGIYFLKIETANKNIITKQLIKV